MCYGDAVAYREGAAVKNVLTDHGPAGRHRKPANRVSFLRRGVVWAECAIRRLFSTSDVPALAKRPLLRDEAAAAVVLFVLTVTLAEESCDESNSGFNPPEASKIQVCPDRLGTSPSRSGRLPTQRAAGTLASIAGRSNGASLARSGAARSGTVRSNVA